MEDHEFIGQYVRYLVLERKGNLSDEEKREKNLIYTNIKNYVITGEDLLEASLSESLPEEFFKDEETERDIKDLTSKLKRIEDEIGNKQGSLIDKINFILDSNSK